MFFFFWGGAGGGGCCSSWKKGRTGRRGGGFGHFPESIPANRNEPSCLFCIIANPPTLLDRFNLSRFGSPLKLQKFNHRALQPWQQRCVCVWYWLHKWGLIKRSSACNDHWGQPLKKMTCPTKWEKLPMVIWGPGILINPPTHIYV